MPDKFVGLTRRQTLAMLGAGALAAPALLSPARLLAAPASHHTIKVGQFEITVFTDGDITLPLKFVLPTIPPADAEALYAANGQKLDVIKGQINVTLVKTPDATILVDCGGGGDFMPTMGRLADNLDKAGVAPDSITHVMFTHAHADHLWGVIDPLDDGTRFTKARHLITGAEFDHWMKPGIENEVPDALKPMAIGTSRRLKAIADRIEQVKPGSEIVPGVAVVDTAGHTPGHVSVLLKSGSDQLLIGGDVLTNPIVSFAKPDWPWGPDTDREMAIATRKRTLDILATEKMRLLGYHLPWPGIGMIERKDTAFRFVQD